MQKANKIMSDSYFLERLHYQLIVVGGDIAGGVYRSQFVLCRRDFVVLCLG